MMRLFKGPEARSHERCSLMYGQQPFPILRDEQNRKWDRYWLDDDTVEGDEAIPGFKCENTGTFVPETDVIIRPSNIVFVSAYHTERVYGGSEEGGWWYDSGELLECVDCHEREVKAVKARLEEKYAEYKSDVPLSSVLSDGTLSIDVGDFPGTSYPCAIPHYE